MTEYKQQLDFASLAVHAGQRPDPSTGAVMTPIYQTTTYAQHEPGRTFAGYDYSRSGNPTRSALEANLAALEGAKFALAFASGCAALTTVLHLLKSGDHVVLCDDVYGGTFRIFDQIFLKLGIQYTQVDMTDKAAVVDAINVKTKLVWIETPTNPLLKVIDIEDIAAAVKAKEKNILVAVDNTFATPYLQRPLVLGADIVSHSSTKYIGGHSDVVGGALCVNDSDLAEQLRYVQNAVGAVPGAMDCFLLLRSTKTLHLRMDAHCKNALELATFLSKHPKIEQVIYPGLKTHPQHKIAKKQMRAFGGMISVQLKADLDYTKQFLSRLELFTLAESLGGVESLIEHPAIMTHASIPESQRKALGISDSLVRISVGVEAVADLRADLDTALS